tara:strand:+ start:191 stop:619 length:429 start_codon:yes stop_codon:yes gene_type:complete
MSTRAQVRFATREDGVSFSEHPEKIHAQFYVHSDGYPEGLGLEIADSYMRYGKIAGWEIEPLNAKHSDLEYIYYVWQKPDDSTWISIFEVNYANDDCECCGMVKYRKDDSKCIFVGTPEKLITKYGSQLDESYYKLNTNDDG